MTHPILEFTCLAGHSSLEVTTDGHATSTEEKFFLFIFNFYYNYKYKAAKRCCQTIAILLTCVPCNCQEMAQGVVTKLRKTVVRHVDSLFFSIAEEGKSLTCRTRRAVGFFYAEQTTGGTHSC